MTDPQGTQGEPQPPQANTPQPPQPVQQPQTQPPTQQQTPPVQVNHPSSDALTKIQQQLQGLPESIVHGLREAGAQLQQAVTASQGASPSTQEPQQQQQPQTQPQQPPAQQSTSDKKQQPSWLARKWFG